MTTFAWRMLSPRMIDRRRLSLSAFELLHFLACRSILEKVAAGVLMFLPQMSLLRTPPPLWIPLSGVIPSEVWGGAFLVLGAAQWLRGRAGRPCCGCLQTSTGLWAALCCAVVLSGRLSFALVMCPLAALGDWWLYCHLCRGCPKGECPKGECVKSDCLKATNGATNGAA